MCLFEVVLAANTRKRDALLSREALLTNEKFPTTIFINAFRGYIDEFSRKKDNKELPEVKVKHKAILKKKKTDQVHVRII